MNNKLLKTFIGHYNACFSTCNGLINRLQNFENCIYFEIFYINLDIIILKIYKDF